MSDIPETIQIDVEGVEDGNNLTVGDITFPEGVTTELAMDDVVVVVADPQEVELPEPEEAGEEPAEDDAEEAGEGDDEE